MNTKILMSSSAITFGILGVVLSFLPQEINSLIGGSATNTLFLQLMGALYIGFAMLNWTAKGNSIGGIYSRPLVIGNFSHFLIGALALSKESSISNNIYLVYGGLIVYSIFALLFGFTLFTNPISKK